MDSVELYNKLINRGNRKTCTEFAIEIMLLLEKEDTDYFPRMEDDEELLWELIDIVIRNTDDITISSSVDNCIILSSKQSSVSLPNVSKYSWKPPDISKNKNKKKIDEIDKNKKKIDEIDKNKKKKNVKITTIIAIDEYGNEYDVGSIPHNKYFKERFGSVDEHVKSTVEENEKILSKYGLRLSVKIGIYYM